MHWWLILLLGQSFRSQKQLACFPSCLGVEGSQTQMCPGAMWFTSVGDGCRFELEWQMQRWSLWRKEKKPDTAGLCPHMGPALSDLQRAACRWLPLCGRGGHTGFWAWDEGGDHSSLATCSQFAAGALGGLVPFWIYKVIVVLWRICYWATFHKLDFYLLLRHAMIIIFPHVCV